jgi:hypothetical protein
VRGPVRSVFLKPLRSAHLGRRDHRRRNPLRRHRRRQEVPDYLCAAGNEFGAVATHHGGAELAGWIEEMSLAAGMVNN